MKKNNLVKLLGVALIVAIVSTGIFYGLFVNKLSSSSGSGKTLVVAVRTLKPGTVVQAPDVRTVPWPTDQLPKGTFGTVDQVVGSTVFDTISEQELVLESKLASTQSGGGAGVPTGMRAVSVHVTDSTGVMSLLHTGQRVDVQVVVVNKNSGETSVRTALEGLSVLAVAPQTEQSSQGHTLPVVTLLAQPAQADVLAAADSGARVRLSLRNPLDQETLSGSSLSLGAIMQRSTPAPPRTASAPSASNVKPGSSPGKP
jgi:pilus assembly protein CpaB